MQDPAGIEAMLIEAARRLESDGRRIAAATLREALQAAAAAPTAAARRRRLADAQRFAGISAATSFGAAASW